MNWPKNNAEIVLLILKNEGGYINRPDDKGGATRYGITIDTLSSWRKTPCTADDIKALSVKEASAIYAQKYIVSPNFDQIADLKLRTALVDFGVLFGPIRAIQALQKSLSQEQDGILGPITLGLANSLTAAGQSHRGMINQLSTDRVSKHADRVTKDPSQLPFLKGWLSRALQFIE